MTWLWQLWPFVSRALHLVEVAHRDSQIEQLERERDYWRVRAEKLMDAALVRAGAVHEPTMVDKPRPPARDAASMIASALGVTEIDSTAKKGAA